MKSLEDSFSELQSDMVAAALEYVTSEADIFEAWHKEIKQQMENKCVGNQLSQSIDE
ncbi:MULTISPECIES: hypothetical protein [Gracilibacillus]|uniref:hypothetical protein n=1 Tax=Gracilibacillus TaxID=74385 RepID=UPI000A462031|nr:MULTISPECIES: hypothetical protein [Gracilibacillus]